MLICICVSVHANERSEKMKQSKRFADNQSEVMKTKIIN